MSENPNASRMTIPLEALAYSNALTLQAVVQLLSEKGILDWKDVLKRVEKLKPAVPGAKGSA